MFSAPRDTGNITSNDFHNFDGNQNIAANLKAELVVAE